MSDTPKPHPSSTDIARARIAEASSLSEHGHTPIVSTPVGAQHHTPHGKSTRHDDAPKPSDVANLAHRTRSNTR